VTELDVCPSESKVYEAVGRLFMASPLPMLKQKLDTRLEEAESEMNNLNTRLVYLETTHQNSRAHIDRLLQQATR
jgi:prefoldin subunit 1